MQPRSITTGIHVLCLVSLIVVGCGQRSLKGGAGEPKAKNNADPFDWSDQYGGTPVPQTEPVEDLEAEAKPTAVATPVPQENQEELGEVLNMLLAKLAKEQGDNEQLYALLQQMAAEAEKAQMEKKEFAKALLTALMVQNCIDGVNKAKAKAIKKMSAKKKEIFKNKTVSECFAKTVSMLQPKMAATIMGIAGNPEALPILMNQVFGKP